MNKHNPLTANCACIDCLKEMLVEQQVARIEAGWPLSLDYKKIDDGHRLVIILEVEAFTDAQVSALAAPTVTRIDSAYRAAYNKGYEDALKAVKDKLEDM